MQKSFAWGFWPLASGILASSKAVACRSVLGESMLGASPPSAL